MLLTLVLVTAVYWATQPSAEEAAVSEPHTRSGAAPIVAAEPDGYRELVTPASTTPEEDGSPPAAGAVGHAPGPGDPDSARPATSSGTSGPVATTAEPASGSGPAIGASSEPAVLEGCRERYVIAPGVEEQVRPLVPEQFTLRHNSNGQPLLYITAIHCQRYSIDGVGRATTAAAFGVSIESPDGTLCATPWPVVGLVKPDLAGSCNNYLVFAAYDNPAVVAWARTGTPNAPVHYVRDLEFEEGGLDPTRLGVPLHFRSGSTPSRYTMDLVVRERAITVPLAAAFWFESAVGTVRVGFDTDAIALGEASGELTVEPGSDMARMLGSTAPSAQQPFPLLAGNRWERATLTKTVHRRRPGP